MQVIARARLPEETVTQARFLLGRLVVRRLPEGLAAGRIVETEAYPPGDAALHAWRGMTRRNRSLFLPHGHAYVYVCYGTAMMLNVSSEPGGVGAGVLIRALAPVEGVALMAARRPGAKPRDLARGPGRLAAALGIDLALDGIDLCRDGALFLAEDGAPTGEIGISTRIGITRDAHRPLRFLVRGSPFLSGPRHLNL
ncbi:putative 3-methyladenine DNA glycosylase [Rhodovastum atsumiense]|uniref:Putative 3-methyladenine DNA glycosylase n=1 Tax=Rhodovastum atsumiense TaxID=504468 RepID=A0A5M6IJH7_9PROT|nr:DNA-3-methyladenine glycosylase [Rhodovastum atsumiense]KAA5608027.1 DNA-3-methyladenine glycosylase [Rhodovastum atsumiense]CAH2604986.1 putative 3-methyladenine DNA glycosylase [Rhodovastum atsumiense]